ncbi:MAG: hypothetical protein GY847_28755 [Proteobacteria bacterium]|nr:hypothetical protein [Pseudomonadota bacterium]
MIVEYEFIEGCPVKLDISLVFNPADGNGWDEPHIPAHYEINDIKGACFELTSEEYDEVWEHFNGKEEIDELVRDLQPCLID